jgi:FkbH-like protein
MKLGLADFAACRINWNDKAAKNQELAEELNLGLDSMVFNDDNPAERGRVRFALPDVLVPEWPDERMLFPSALANLRCFDPTAVTDEDRRRSEEYAVRRLRNTLMREAQSVDEWLISLNTRVVAELLTDKDLARATQLLNRTNQMNLSTRRMTEAELKVWAAHPTHRVWVFRVNDRFGDSGLTGIISTAEGNEGTQIVDFVLSCRVFNRRVEEAMLYTVLHEAYASGTERLYAQYRPTARNGPCLDFWRSRSTFLEVENGSLFSWDFSKPLVPPPGVELVRP